MTTTAGFEEVLSFWLGDLDASGCATEEASARWWKKSDAFDAEIRERFGAAHESICDDAREAWLDAPRSRVAYVIVLDQFSRNMFRGSPRMYAEDPRALRATLGGLEAEHDEELGYHERYFLYMPLMHAEDVAHQDRCVQLFEGMKTLYPERSKQLERTVGFAVQHRDIVARFGRFPHRNAILGRESTAEELSFLEGPGSSF